MEQFAVWLTGIGLIILMFAAAWLLGKIVDWARQRYRRKVWEAALYIAREQPDLVEDVADQHDLSPSTEMVRVDRRPRPSLSIESMSRSELDTYAHTLEDRLRLVYNHWAASQGEIDSLRSLLAHTEKLRLRYWNRIKRVIAAEQSGDDIFPALHPYLARLTT